MGETLEIVAIVKIPEGGGGSFLENCKAVQKLLDKSGVKVILQLPPRGEKKEEAEALQRITNRPV